MTNNDSGYRTEVAAKTLGEEKDQYWIDPDLPWKKIRTPYRIFVAELLLVRTQTDLVVRIYDDFIAKYPDIRTLAQANFEILSKDLETLGLKKRIPFILKAANFIINEYNGKIPNKIESLLLVPGIGIYTATAIAAFGFNSDKVPADVNILRFLSRLTGSPMSHPSKGSKELRELLPNLSKARGGPEPENLLDFTRKICGPRKPDCTECILKNICHYYQIQSDQ